MDPRIANAIEIIEKNYGDHLHLSQIAREVGLSRSRFEHLFKQETGQDYRSYLLSIRMAKAKDLMANQSLTIQQVADQVGYPHARNFVRIFKRRFGETPSTFRKELRQHIRRENSALEERIAHSEI
jgi:AraC-like DNA-binding protein